MASKHSSASLSSKQRQLMSKKEQKTAVVARRLSMLRNDDDNDDDDQNCNPIKPVIVTHVVPLQHHIHSESIHGTRNKLKRNCDDSRKQNCLSLKRRMVISDDKSEQDGKIQCMIQPKESFSQNGSLGGTNQKKLACNDPNNPASLKITSFAELPAEDKLSTPMDRATKVQANLSAAYPSFVKTMLSSHVSGGFWLGLPSKFCENLPKEDCAIVLVDEAGEEFKTKYLAHKRGLSGGWRGFSIHQELQKGDVLVFHLIHPTIFKVYIIREGRLNMIDGALGLLRLDTCAGQIISGDSTQKVFHTEDSPPVYSPSSSNSDIDQPEVLDGIRFSDSDINFKAIKDFNNFNIIIEGLVIDSKFSHSNIKKYYDLCLSQNSFLHQHLLKGMNCNLIIGIILETINIADAVKACDSSTSIEDLQTWKTTLKGFELVGMKVGFLCDRLNQLLHIASELNQLDTSNMSEAYTLELGSANGRMKALEGKLAELKGVMEKIDFEIEAEMTTSVQKYKARLDKIDKFPW